MKENVPNFLTFDVEEWFDAEIPRRKIKGKTDFATNVEKQVDVFIDICSRLEVKSTCFVVGKLAKKKPNLVKKLYNAGHEIASHSYSHKLIYSMSPNEFRNDLIKSVAILEDITGEKVKGFRAPTWSINSNISKWYYDVLQQENITYSSSVYPAKTFLYGMPEANPNIHFAKDSGVLEIPQQLANLGLKKIGFSGGTYIRLFPIFLVKYLIKMKNSQNKSVFLYAHPWELIYEKYNADLSIFESLIQYYGVKRNAEKLEKICHHFKNSFTRMDYYSLGMNNNKLID